MLATALLASWPYPVRDSLGYAAPIELSARCTDFAAKLLSAASAKKKQCAAGANARGRNTAPNRSPISRYETLDKGRRRTYRPATPLRAKSIPVAGSGTTRRTLSIKTVTGIPAFLLM